MKGFDHIRLVSSFAEAPSNIIEISTHELAYILHPIEAENYLKLIQQKNLLVTFLDSQFRKIEKFTNAINYFRNYLLDIFKNDDDNLSVKYRMMKKVYTYNFQGQHFLKVFLSELIFTGKILAIAPINVKSPYRNLVISKTGECSYVINRNNDKDYNIFYARIHEVINEITAWYDNITLHMKDSLPSTLTENEEATRHSKQLNNEGTADTKCYLNTLDIKFTQPTISPNFSSGETLTEVIRDLRSGKKMPTDFPLIRVVEVDGVMYSIDNRRLAAFQQAQIGQIPVELVSMDDPEIAEKFESRFKPIEGTGDMIIYATKRERATALSLLRKYNKLIKDKLTKEDNNDR